MKNKHEIINKVIADTNSESYLEIGYGEGNNFKEIECKIKSSCDPESKSGEPLKMTSDEFFEAHKEKVFEVIFIDGDHTAEQVRKDITNALKCNPKAIILHDTIPHSKQMQEVPRKQKEWTGDVWRSVVGFIENYPDVKVETYRSDYGLTVIYPEGKKVRKHFENMEMSYEEFKEKEVELLNVID